MPTTSYDDFTAGVRAIGARTDSAGVAATDLASDEDRLINHILTEGYLSHDAFKVAADSPASMDVIVGSGTAKADRYVVEGDDDGQHPYIVRLDDASITVTLDAADASNPRIDELWLVVADATWDAGSVSLPRIGYRKGDAGASPSAPGPDSSWKAAVKLATITVAAAATSVDSGDIADNRSASGLTSTLNVDADTLDGMDSTAFAAVAGDTFTGAVTFNALATFLAGVEANEGSDILGEGHAPSSYPDGLSWMELDGTRTWAPGNTGATVVTFNFGDANKTWQLHVLGNPGTPSTLSYRTWTVSSASWGSWRTVTTAENPGEWEVDNSTEVGSYTLTTSMATAASVSLTIPSDWGSWKCAVYATYGYGVASPSTQDELDTQIVIDGTAQQTQNDVLAKNVGHSGAIAARRTGMTTTGSRTITLQAFRNGDAGTMYDIHLYARAVRTS